MRIRLDSRSIMYNSRTLFLINVLASLAVLVHFISLVLGVQLLTITLTNLLYLLPGYYACALVARKTVEIFDFLIHSFLLSILLNSIIFLFLFTLNLASVSLFLFYSFVLLLGLIGVLVEYKRRDAILVHHRLSAIVIYFLTSLLLSLLFSLQNRFLVEDETAYVSTAVGLIREGVIMPIGVEFYSNVIEFVIRGKALWTTLLGSYMTLSGQAPSAGYYINTMFLAMIPVCCLAILKAISKGNNRYFQTFVYLLILFNGSLLYYSLFILNDTVVTLLTTMAVYSLLRSLEIKGDRINVNPNYFLEFAILSGIIFLIKENIVIVGVFLLLFLVIIARYKLYTGSLFVRSLYYLILAAVIGYEVLIDFPFVIFGYLVRNPSVVSILSKFVVVSPLEKILLLFVTTPWSTATIFSLSSLDWADHFYTSSHVSTISVPLVSAALISPILLRNMRIPSVVHIKLLSAGTLLTFFIYYILTSLDSLSDVSRYTLPLVPLVIVLSVALLAELIEEKNYTKLLMLCLPGLFYLQVVYTLMTERHRVVDFLGLSTGPYIYFLLMGQFLIYFAIAMLLLPRRSDVKVTVKKIGISLFLLMLILSNAIILSSSLRNSEFFKDRGYSLVAKELNDLSTNGGETIVMSNAYIQLRSYINEKSKILLMPPPIHEEEFIDFMKVAPNNTVVVISSDPLINYEYSNSWIKKYAVQNFVSIGIPKRQIVFKPNFIFPFDELGNGTMFHIYGGTLADGKWGKALHLNGVNEYAELDAPLGQSYSISLWFKLDILPGNFTDYGKVILMKGVEPYIEFAVGISKDGRISFYSNDGSKPVVSLRSPQNLIRDTLWHQLILVVGGGTKLYLDGKLILKSELYPVLKLEEPLRIGADRRGSPYLSYRYFPGLIDEIQIYSFPLSDDQISNYWYGLRLVRRITVNTYAISIFRLDSPINQLKQTRGDAQIINVSINTNSSGVILSLRTEKFNEPLVGLIKTIRFSAAIKMEPNSKNQFFFPFYEAGPYLGRKLGFYLLNNPTILLFNPASGASILDRTLRTIYTFDASNSYLLVASWLLPSILLIFVIRKREHVM